MLQSYLQGNKAYTARGELGYETDTLDLDGVVTKRAPFSHVTAADLESILPRFTGSIYQVPPMYSAIKQGGKKLYQIAREGKTVPLLEARRVDIHSLSCTDASRLPHFDIFLECGGGTYVRSLIRDMGAAVGSAATTVSLRRVQQGPFLERHALSQDQWTPDAIYQAIDECQALLLNHENK
jgi:tRNA pseudouridine55 synthase